MIWVLYGGSSAEREVSLRTGRAMIDGLERAGLKVKGFDVRPGDVINLPWQEKPEMVMIGLHGTWGEDGTLQGFLDSIGVPYVGCGVTSSALCFHKGLAKKQLKTFGVPVPDGFEVQGPEQLKNFLTAKTCPADFFDRRWFLKAARQGSTVGIERYDPQEKSGKEHFLSQAKKVFVHDHHMLIEEWILGPEYTVAVVGHDVLPVIEIRPKSEFYDYQSKYTVGATEYLCPAPITNERAKTIQDIAVRAFEALECRDYGRVDIMWCPKGGPKVLEMNTLPGMTETSLVPKAAAAHGWSFPEFLGKLVELVRSRPRR